MAMQRLVIVRRNEFATFARLAQTFANEPNVRLVWDRRIRDRRQSSEAPAGERRRRDRRANPTTTWGPDDYLLLTIAQPESTAPGDAGDPTTEQRTAITEELRRDVEAAAASDLSVLISGGEPVTRGFVLSPERHPSHPAGDSGRALSQGRFAPTRSVIR